MMIRVAIVDDEKYILQKLQSFIMQEFQSYGIDCDCYIYLSAKEFIVVQKKKPFDIVFLDIMIPEYSGFQAAAEIRKLQSHTDIIFITSNDESVYDSFEFLPFQFIRKDCDDFFEQRIKHAVASLVRHLKQNGMLILQLPFSEERKVKVGNIIAVKSDRNYLEVYCIDKSILRVRSKLSEIEADLLAYDFVRVHNRWLINMRYICLLDYPNEEVIMINDLSVPLSRSHKSRMQKRYAEYLRSTQ